MDPIEIFHHVITVGKSDLDDNDHVNNVRYVQWMQDAASRHARKLGWPVDRLQALGLAWVVRSHWIEYHRPARLGDEITVQTWVAGFQKVRSPRRYRFLGPGGRTQLARAETDWVMVHAASGRPAPIPAELIADFPVVAPDREPGARKIDEGRMR